MRGSDAAAAADPVWRWIRHAIGLVLLAGFVAYPVTMHLENKAVREVCGSVAVGDESAPIMSRAEDAGRVAAH